MSRADQEPSGGREAKSTPRQGIPQLVKKLQPRNVPGGELRAADCKATFTVCRPDPEWTASGMTPQRMAQTEKSCLPHRLLSGLTGIFDVVSLNVRNFYRRIAWVLMVGPATGEGRRTASKGMVDFRTRLESAEGTRHRIRDEIFTGALSGLMPPQRDTLLACY